MRKRNLDWVPMEGYGDGFQITSPSTAVTELPLLDTNDGSSADDVEGKIELDNSMFLHRIVGQFRIFSLNEVTSAGLALIRIGMGMVDLDNGGVLTPYTFRSGVDMFGGAVDANNDFWWERRLQVDSTVDDVSGYWSQLTHPWWNVIDFKPRRRLTRLEVPTITIAVPLFPNGDSTVQVAFYLRLLVSTG